AKTGSEYVIFQKMGEKQATVLPKLSGTFAVRWFHPKTGKFVGKAQRLTTKDQLKVGLPPQDTEQDWVLWVRKV
ncbi:MAG: putative collagen-binding domain-containing protein, partial [Bacteroidota bacterium]